MTGLRLLGRRAAADRGVLTVLGLLVLVTVLLGSLGLRWWADRSDAALQQTVAHEPALLTGLATTIDTRASVVLPADRLDEMADTITRGAPDDLEAVVEPATWSTLRTRVEFDGIRGEYASAPHLVDLRALSALDEHVEVLEGTLPGPGTPGAAGAPAVAEVVLLRGDAETLGLAVGDELPLLVPEPVTSEDAPGLPPGAAGPSVQVPGGGTVAAPVPGAVTMRVTGLVEQDDADSPFWAAYGFGLGGYLEGLGGDAPPIVRGSVLLGPDAYATLSQSQLGAELQVTWWQPVRVDRLRVEDVEEVQHAVGAVRSFASRLYAPEALRPAQVATDLDGVLDRYAQERAAVVAALAVAASGLAAVAVLVLLLAVVMVAGRREPAAALTRARGSSSTQEAVRAGLETALVVVPAAGVGLALAAWARPVDAGRAPPVLGGLVALAVVLGAAVAAARGGRRLGAAREEARTRPSARQLVVEGLVVAVCLGSLVLARRRSGGDAQRLDLLLASVPWLAALVASLVATHLAQPVLRALAGRLARRRGSFGFLAVARAARAGSAGRLVGLAVVTTLATTLFAATVSGAVERGRPTARGRRRRETSGSRTRRPATGRSKPCARSRGWRWRPVSSSRTARRPACAGSSAPRWSWASTRPSSPGSPRARRCARTTSWPTRPGPPRASPPS